jgi:hypothetical protein
VNLAFAAHFAVVRYGYHAIAADWRDTDGLVAKMPEPRRATDDDCSKMLWL